MDGFLRDAERILDTAVAAVQPTAAEYVICVSRTGSIRMLSDITGWSLPALAAELGASALYRVERRRSEVRVEGWSYGRKCLVSKDLCSEWWSRPCSGVAYATFQLLEAGGVSQKDLSPQVRNS